MTIYSKEFWKDTLQRAVRTMAQTAVSMLVCAEAMHEVNWLNVGSVSLLAGVICILMALARGEDE